MTSDPDPPPEPAPKRPPAPAAPPPSYRRYRAGPKIGRRHSDLEADPTLGGLRGRRGGRRGGRGGDDDGPVRPPRRRRWPHLTPRRVVGAVVTLAVGWVVISLALFLISSHFERIAPPAGIKSELDAAGSPLISANNILVLGSDQRVAGSKEPGAFSAPSRSDVILLIRTGGGHAARLSIPRDTVVNIPGHGLQKINAAFAYGGAAEALSVIKNYLGIKINHLVEVNFASFPSLVNAMGGVTYTGGCIVSYISGGFRDGGYTLRLSAGTHRLNGEQALALARTRENACAPNETDLDRERHQQALFQDMEHQLTSPSILLRLPWVSWNAPPTIISDLSGPSLLQLFAALAIGGSTPTRLLTPSGSYTLADGEVGLSVSNAERDAAVAQFLKG
jgi:LCP family protein required for cell wall assembly